VCQYSNITFDNTQAIWRRGRAVEKFHRYVSWPTVGRFLITEDRPRTFADSEDFK
jgi:hypothetical protein